MIKDFNSLPDAEELDKLEAEGWELITIVECKASNIVRGYFREKLVQVRED